MSDKFPLRLLLKDDKNILRKDCMEEFSNQKQRALDILASFREEWNHLFDSLASKTQKYFEKFEENISLHQKFIGEYTNLKKKTGSFQAKELEKMVDLYKTLHRE
jgi:hypothetical protein